MANDFPLYFRISAMRADDSEHVVTLQEMRRPLLLGAAEKNTGPRLRAQESQPAVTLSVPVGVEDFHLLRVGMYLELAPGPFGTAMTAGDISAVQALGQQARR